MKTALSAVLRVWETVLFELISVGTTSSHSNEILLKAHFLFYAIYRVSNLRLRKNKGINCHFIFTENANKRYLALLWMWKFMKI